MYIFITSIIFHLYHAPQADPPFRKSSVKGIAAEYNIILKYAC